MKKIIIGIILFFGIFSHASAQSVSFNTVILQFQYNGATVTPALLIYADQSTTTAACTPTGTIFPSYPRELIADTFGATSTRTVVYNFQTACTVSANGYAKFTDDNIWVLSNGGVNTPTGDRYYTSLDDGSVFSYTGTNVSHYFALTGNIAYSSTFNSLVEFAMKNASSTVPECGITHLGGCISQAGIYLFYPDPALMVQFQELSFASSSPFGYLYDMDNAYQTFMTAINATSSSFKVVIDLSTLKNTSSVFNQVSSSSITAFDVCWVNRKLGEVDTNSYRDNVLPIIVYMMWIGLGWLFYATAHKIW